MKASAVLKHQGDSCIKLVVLSEEKLSCKKLKGVCGGVPLSPPNEDTGKWANPAGAHFHFDS